MRKSADYPRTLVQKRRRKELKRKAKRDAIQKVSGKGMTTAGSLRQVWTGLEPRQIEGFLLSIKGVTLTKKNWPFKEIAFGERMRVV